MMKTRRISKRIILMSSESMAQSLRIAMGSTDMPALTATNHGYRFIVCEHPRRAQTDIVLLDGTVIGFICAVCDGAIYKDNLDELIKNCESNYR